MRYGERLRLARETAKGYKVTQAALAELAGIDQSLISQLETSLTAEGSQYTNRFARVLGISADWLADEIGEMIPSVYSTTNPKIGRAMMVMEQSADYVQEAAVTAVLTTCELAARAKANGNNQGHG